MSKDYQQGEEEVTKGSFQLIMKTDREAIQANMVRKGVFNHVVAAPNKQGPTLSEVSMDAALIIAEEDAGALSGDIGTDQVQEDLNEKRNPVPEAEISETAKQAIKILGQPKYQELWNKLPNPERFKKHLLALKDGQIGSDRFTESLLVLWLEQPSVYDTDPDFLTSTNIIKLTAKLAGLDMSKPVNAPARAIPPAMMPAVEEMVQQYAKMGILEHDFGPWN
jgi:hypothetical protein